MKLFHLTYREAGMTIWVQLLRGPAPLSYKFRH